MKYAVYVVGSMDKPYCFQDQDAGTQTPAIFDKQEDAYEVCDFLNKMSEKFCHKAKHIVSIYREHTSCEECMHKCACYVVHNIDKTHNTNAYATCANVVCPHYMPYH